MTNWDKCQVCGRDMYDRLKQLYESGAIFGEYDLWDTRAPQVTVGGKCGRCGKLCCDSCLKNSACPACRNILDKCGGSVL